MILPCLRRRRLTAFQWSTRHFPTPAREESSELILISEREPGATAASGRRMFTARQLVHGWGSLTVSTARPFSAAATGSRSEEHTSELQSRLNLVCRLLLENKKKTRGEGCGCALRSPLHPPRRDRSHGTCYLSRAPHLPPFPSPGLSYGSPRLSASL